MWRPRRAVLAAAALGLAAGPSQASPAPHPSPSAGAEEAEGEGACDPDSCYFISGQRYEPDLPNQGTSSERSPEHCQERCRSVEGCSHFTFSLKMSNLQDSVGKCALQGEAAQPVKADKAELAGPADWPACCQRLPRLVHQVVTFGAPAISYPAASNPGDECVPGVRIYTENTKLPGGGIGVQDDAAAMFTRFPHAKTPVLVVRPPGEPSHYKNCTNRPSDAEVLVERMPFFKPLTYHDWLLHGITGVYGERVSNITVPGVDTEALRRRVGLVVKLGSFAASTYDEDLGKSIETVRDLPPWRLVGFSAVKGSVGDVDTQLLVQNEEGRCTLNFEGSSNLADLALFASDYGSSFCGFADVHEGVRKELDSIVNSPTYVAGVKAKLPKCRSVGCVGHSLGGALCELFVLCANSGRQGNKDYEAVSWRPNSPWEHMPEMQVGDHTLAAVQVLHVDALYHGKQCGANATSWITDSAESAASCARAVHANQSCASAYFNFEASSNGSGKCGCVRDLGTNCLLGQHLKEVDGTDVYHSTSYPVVASVLYDGAQCGHINATVWLATGSAAGQEDSEAVEACVKAVLAIDGCSQRYLHMTKQGGKCGCIPDSPGLNCLPHGSKVENESMLTIHMEGSPALSHDDITNLTEALLQSPESVGEVLTDPVWAAAADSLVGDQDERKLGNKTSLWEARFPRQRGGLGAAAPLGGWPQRFGPISGWSVLALALLLLPAAYAALRRWPTTAPAPRYRALRLDEAPEVELLY